MYTLFLGPGPVTNLEINTIISENSVIIKWSTVTETNGIITSYKVNVSEYDGPQVSTQIVENPQTLQVLVSGLSKTLWIFLLLCFNYLIFFRGFQTIHCYCSSH